MKDINRQGRREKMARNPTGCDVKKTCVSVLLTLATMATMGIADHLATSQPPTVTLSQTGTLIVSSIPKVTLTCVVDGHPSPKIDWYYNGNILDYSRCSDYYMKDGNQVLNLVTPKSCTGTFWCTAKNKFGTAFSDKVLLIDHGLLSIRRTQSVQTLEHDSQLIKAPQQFQNGLGKISWEPTNDRFVLTSTGQLFIRDVLASDNKQRFKCTYDIAGESLNCGFKTLNVTRSPQEDKINCHHCNVRSELTYLEGDTVILDCLVSGSPKPVITWTHNGKVVDNGLQLRVPMVTLRHSGHYKCTAKNKAGQKTKDYSLNIQSKPIMTEEPQNVTMNVNQLVNDRVEFQCRGTGIPTPQAEWSISQNTIKHPTNFTNYSATTDDKNGTLRILVTGNEVFATVHCNLSNSHGYQWFQARLSITGTRTKILSTTSIETTKNVDKTTIPSTTSTRSSSSTTVTKTTATSTASSTTTSTTPEPLRPLNPPTDHSNNAGTHGEQEATGGGERTTTVENSVIVVELGVNALFIAIGVAAFILVIGSIVCTIVCYRACQKKNHRRDRGDDIEVDQRYPRSVSSLSYISQLQRIRDFDDRASDRASEDSGIDERSHMKSKNSIPRGVNHDNQRNEMEEMVSMEDVV